MKSEKLSIFHPPLSTLHSPLPLRLRFKKEGLCRFISHLDWTRSILRGMARAGVPFVYTQGFSPRPKISFGPPLSLGWESETELMDVECRGDPVGRPLGRGTASPLRDLSQKINENLPQGLQLVEAVFVDKSRGGGTPPLREIKYVTYGVGLLRHSRESGNPVKPFKQFEPFKFLDSRLRGNDGNYGYSIDLAGDRFILKVEVTARMKDILNEISESLGESNIFVKRLAFYDRSWNRI